MPLCPECEEDAQVSVAALGDAQENETRECSRCGKEF